MRLSRINRSAGPCGRAAHRHETVNRVDNDLKANSQKTTKQVSLLGLGLDGDDGHTRLTRGPEFVLFGGSSETHAQMQETVIKLNERLDKRGKRLSDATPGEVRDILNDLGR